MAYTLSRPHLNFNPQYKDYFNRDRFVLSAGHGSALLYSLLHVSGSLKLEELKQFRQWGSKHQAILNTDILMVSSFSWTTGQGFAMSVGLALGGRITYREI